MSATDHFQLNAVFVLFDGERVISEPGCSEDSLDVGTVSVTVLPAQEMLQIGAIWMVGSKLSHDDGTIWSQPLVNPVEKLDRARIVGTTIQDIGGDDGLLPPRSLQPSLAGDLPARNKGQRRQGHYLMIYS